MLLIGLLTEILKMLFIGLLADWTQLRKESLSLRIY